eukprot:TRINITY_DN4609_c0_g1_i5.p1 TRINITY_DN4609_c0_g1~~TRINITY_DN4609_c0_g1_i5.p1  ORF type:complete len:143 (+),score=45.76 TRINITY_DN4609_c0_g1_i5:37-429(+)
MPAVEGKPWYSFNYGPVHVVVISTEHNFNDDSEQIKWLKKDLAAVDRKVHPWVEEWNRGGHSDHNVKNILQGTLFYKAAESALRHKEWKREPLDQKIMDHVKYDFIHSAPQDANKQRLVETVFQMVQAIN